MSRDDVFWNLTCERKKKFRPCYLFCSTILWDTYCYPNFLNEEMVAKRKVCKLPKALLLTRKKLCEKHKRCSVSSVGLSQWWDLFTITYLKPATKQE